MNLRKEVTAVVREADGPVGPTQVAHAIRRRTGHNVRDATVIGHMRARTKLGGGADLTRDPATGLYAPVAR